MTAQMQRGNPKQKDKGINLKEEYANLCAYYPYSATVTDAARVTLTPHIAADDETRRWRMPPIMRQTRRTRACSFP